MSDLITRTSKGMVDALFNTIDELNQRKIDPEHARAISHTARTIVRIAEVELNVMRFSKDASANGAEKTTLKSLSLDDADAK